MGLMTTLPLPLPLIIALAAVLVVSLGVGIGVTQVVLGRRRAEALVAWTRGAYALWTGGEDSATWNRDRAAKSLDAWYGAKSSGGLWGVIEDLRRGQTGNRAWDLVRALDLLRIGMAAGYVDQDAFSESASKIASDLRANYSGWENLAQGFEAGMHAWQRGRNVQNPDELGRVQRHLPRLRGEIWPRIQWGASLPAND
jgi:hypothetical protein